MSINLYDVELTARARHKDLLREAEERRLVKQALAARPKKEPAIVAWFRRWFRRPATQEQAPCVQVAC